MTTLTTPASEFANLDISSLIGSGNPSYLSISAASMQNKLREGAEREGVFLGRFQKHAFNRSFLLSRFTSYLQQLELQL